MERGGCIYIMTNRWNTVLYVGVTSNLLNRVYEHSVKKYPNSFTSRHNCDKLVYYCFYTTIEEAIAAEKRIKGGNRKQKIAMIESVNREWKDLKSELVEE